MKMIVVPSSASRLIEKRGGPFDHIGGRTDTGCMIEQTLTQPARCEDVLHGRVVLRNQRRHERPVARVIEPPLGIRARRAIGTEIDEPIDVNERALRIDDIEADIDITTAAMRTMRTHAPAATSRKIAHRELRAWELLRYVSRSVLDQRDELVRAVVLIAIGMLDADGLGRNELAPVLESSCIVSSNRNARR
jgi:hypothetical protein